MVKQSVRTGCPLVVIRDEWPHSSGATGPESIRSEIIVTWDRWQDVSLPLSRHSFFGPTAEYHPSVEEDDPIIAAANWHHLRASMVALFRHECWNGITSNPSAETMARLIDEAACEPPFPWQHTAERLEAARRMSSSDIQPAMRLFLASLPDVVEVSVPKLSDADVSGWPTLSPAELRTLFDIEQDALRRRLKSQAIPNRFITTKAYRVDPSALPDDWKRTIKRA